MGRNWELISQPISWVLLGGLMVGACPHGVVYYAKTLLGGESAGDHLDAARSQKMEPIVYLGDMAMTVGCMAEKHAPEVPAAKTRGAVVCRTDSSASKQRTPTVMVRLQFDIGVYADAELVQDQHFSLPHLFQTALDLFSCGTLVIKLSMDTVESVLK
jgi:hypothetical protein